MKWLMWFLVVLLFVFVVWTQARAFDIKDFPDIGTSEPSHTAYHEQRDVFWEIFDVNYDGEPDCARGYQPNEATPMFMMTPYGMMVYWNVDVEGVSPTFYWLDMADDTGKKDGIPFKEQDNEKDDYEYDCREILYDPQGDGLNGNEQGAYQKLGPKLAT